MGRYTIERQSHFASRQWCVIDTTSGFIMNRYSDRVKAAKAGAHLESTERDDVRMAKAHYEATLDRAEREEFHRLMDASMKKP